MRVGGCAGCVRSKCCASRWRASGTGSLGALSQPGPGFAFHGFTFAWRRFRPNCAGPGRCARAGGAPDSAERVVPFAACGGKHANDFAGSFAGIERKNMRFAGLAFAKRDGRMVVTFEEQRGSNFAHAELLTGRLDQRGGNRSHAHSTGGAPLYRHRQKFCFSPGRGGNSSFCRLCGPASRA